MNDRAAPHRRKRWERGKPFRADLRVPESGLFIRIGLYAIKNKKSRPIGILNQRAGGMTPAD